MKMHYTQKELTAIKRKLGLRWVTSWQGTTLQVGAYHPHFRVSIFISKKSGEPRYKLEACRSDLRISGAPDDRIGTFDTSDAAMAFAEWLLPAVDEQEEAAQALRKEKRRVEREKEMVEEAARAAKAREVNALVALLAEHDIVAKPAFGSVTLEITPSELRKLAFSSAWLTQLKVSA